MTNGTLTTKRRFKQVDVFTAKPFYGNPVAVVIDAEGLSTDDMQRIARWTNLSETTFLLPPTQAGADYRLRIFTPGSELPFAGHPTVGSAHAAIEAGVVPAKASLIQECAAGLLPLVVSGEGAARTIAVEAPAARHDPLTRDQYAELAAALGTDWHAGAAPTTVNLGAVWLIVELRDAEAVSRLAPDMAKIAALSTRHKLTGITVFGRTTGGDDAINVRSFAPAHGVPEDPVCGSGNAAVGAYISTRAELADLASGYRSSQGREIGRDGHVTVTMAGGRVQIGGHAVTCIDGTLTT
jgi:PhzF family phenazine biosynthesis protein